MSSDSRAFRSRIRAELYAVVRAMAALDYDEAAASVRATPDAWTAADFERVATAYVAERGPIRFDGRIRQGWTTQVEPDGPHRWRIRQILVDDGELDDDEGESASTWSLDGVVDIRDDTNPTGPIIEITNFEG